MRWSPEVLQSYYRDGGDYQFRINHYQDPSLIVEIGACDGEFTEKLSIAFPDALIVAVEPVPSLFARAEERLQGRSNVALTNAGLWTESGQYMMSEEGPASCLATNGVRVEMNEVCAWLAELGWIDLLIMNVEGAEYQLLGPMIQSRIVGHIGNLQIQFHDVNEFSPTYMELLQRELWETHYPSYMYPFCMENWRFR